MGFDLDTLIGKTIIQWVTKVDTWKETELSFETLYLLFECGLAIAICPTSLIKDLQVYELGMTQKEEIFTEPYKKERNEDG